MLASFQSSRRVEEINVLRKNLRASRAKRRRPRSVSRVTHTMHRSIVGRRPARARRPPTPPLAHIAHTHNESSIHHPSTAPRTSHRPRRVAIIPRHATRVSRRSRRARARIAPHARIPRRAVNAQYITHLHHDNRSIVHTHAPLFVFVFYVAARKDGSARARRRDGIDGVGLGVGIRTFGVKSFGHSMYLYLARVPPFYTYTARHQVHHVRTHAHAHAHAHTHTRAHAHRTFVSCTTHTTHTDRDDRRRPTTSAPAPAPASRPRGGGDRTRRRVRHTKTAPWLVRRRRRRRRRSLRVHRRWISRVHRVRSSRSVVVVVSAHRAMAMAMVIYPPSARSRARKATEDRRATHATDGVM